MIFRRGTEFFLETPVNMRYALDWCLFGFPQGDKETASNQCIPACGRISNALEINLLNVTASSTYDFCQDPDFLPNVGSCASCYKTVPNQLYLSNCKRSFPTSGDRHPNKSSLSSQHPRVCMSKSGFARAKIPLKTFRYIHIPTPIQFL